MSHFLRSSNVREEMAGRMLTQHLPLKRLNMRMVIIVKMCCAVYLLAFPVWVFWRVFSWGVGWGRLLFCLYLKARKLNSKRKLVELWKYLIRTQLDNHRSRECGLYPWMLQSQQRVCCSNHRTLCPCRIPQGTRALVAPQGTIPPGMRSPDLALHLTCGLRKTHRNKLLLASELEQKELLLNPRLAFTLMNTSFIIVIFPSYFDC